MVSRKHKRHKLLLDEGLYFPKAYPNLNNLHNVVHVAQTRYKGHADIDIYKFANKLKRMPVVYNIKHFRPLLSTNSVSVIHVSNNLSNKDADLKICKTLRELKPSEEKGHVIQISNQNIVIRRMV